MSKTIPLKADDRIAIAVTVPRAGQPYDFILTPSHVLALEDNSGREDLKEMAVEALLEHLSKLASEAAKEALLQESEELIATIATAQRHIETSQARLHEIAKLTGDPSPLARMGESS